MKQRIVFYDARKFSADNDILLRMEAISKLSRQKLLAALRAETVFSIDDLEEAVAAENAAYFKGRDMDIDVEPMALEGAQKEWFLTESRKWAKRNLVLPFQMQKLFAQYGVLSEFKGFQQVKAKDPNALIRAVMTIGAVFVGLGIVLFIAANWQRIPGPIKIAGDLLLSLIFLHTAFHQADQRLSRALYLISFFGIGGAILLMGQIYHVQADSYLLPLVWGFILLPVALLLNVSLALYCSVGLWSFAMLAYRSANDTTTWFYPALILGFLIPYGVLKSDKKIINTALGCAIAALAIAGCAGELWMTSIWLLALVLFYVKEKSEKYEIFLLGGFIFWHIAFMQQYKNFPDIFYIFPLIYFTMTTVRRGSNGFAILNIFNALFWLATFYFQISKRFSLVQPQGLDIFLFIFCLSLFFYGAGLRLRGQEIWQPLSRFLKVSGIVVLTVAAYGLSFKFYKMELSFYCSALYSITALCFFSAGLVWIFKALIDDFNSQKRVIGEVVLFVLLGTGILLTWILPPRSPVFVPIFNLVLFFEALVLMVKGYREKKIDFYNFGIALFVLLIVTRYFDTLSALMPRSVFFILGGVFLIGWAVFISRQKRIQAEDAQHV